MRIENDKYYTPIPIYQWLQRQLKLEPFNFCTDWKRGE